MLRLSVKQTGHQGKTEMLLKNFFEAIERTGQGKTAVIGWGRGMGHKGHMMLASSVITKAKSVGGDPYFVVSRTMGKDDPLSADEKLAIYKKVFPQQGHIFQAASDELPDLTRVLANLNQQGYSDAVVVVGADQVKAFQYLNNYNGKPNKAGDIPFNFNTLQVISRQETGDPSAGEEGPRATPMRNILNDPNATPQQQFQVWRDAMSPEVSDDEVRQLMLKAKQRMDQFSTPKKKIKEKMLPKSSFAGTPKNKLGPAAHLKGKMKRPAGQGDLVGDAQEGVAEGGYDDYKSRFKYRELQHELGHELNPPRQKPKGMYFYTVRPMDLFKAKSLGLKQSRSGKWYSAIPNPQADKEFGPGKYWEPKNESQKKQVPIGESYEKEMSRLINKIIINETVQNNQQKRTAKK